MVNRSDIEFTEEEQKVVKRTFPFDCKPVLYVANVDEDVVADADSIDYKEANS